jgi:hypothetical protein
MHFTGILHNRHFTGILYHFIQPLVASLSVKGKESTRRSFKQTEIPYHLDVCVGAHLGASVVAERVIVSVCVACLSQSLFLLLTRLSPIPSCLYLSNTIASGHQRNWYTPYLMRFLVIVLKRQGKFVNKNIDILGIFDAHIFVILASTFLRQAVPLLSHRTVTRISSFPSPSRFLSGYCSMRWKIA